MFALGMFAIIPQGYAVVIERWGKYHRTMESGLRFKLPFIERTREIYYRAREIDVGGSTRIVTKRSSLIDLREQVLDFPKQSVITSDNVTMEIDAVLYYQIVEPSRAIYGVANLVDAIEKLVQTTLRDVVGRLTLDETLASREEINIRLRGVLEEATPAWGVRVVRVEIQEIAPPEDIRKRMELQMTAEREKRAQILRAEGEKQSAILEAEGASNAEIKKAEAKKRARILEAEGIAEARLAIAEAEAESIAQIGAKIGKTKATEYLVALKYLEALRNLSDGKATKIFLPFEASGILGALGSISEMWGNSSREKEEQDAGEGSGSVDGDNGM